MASWGVDCTVSSYLDVSMRGVNWVISGKDQSYASNDKFLRPIGKI